MSKQDPDAIMVAVALTGSLQRLPTKCIVCDASVKITAVDEHSRSDDGHQITLVTKCRSCDTPYYIKYSAEKELYSRKGDRVWNLAKWSINPDDLLEELNGKTI